MYRNGNARRIWAVKTCDWQGVSCEYDGTASGCDGDAPVTGIWTDIPGDRGGRLSDWYKDRDAAVFRYERGRNQIHGGRSVGICRLLWWKQTWYRRSFRGSVWSFDGGYSGDDGEDTNCSYPWRGDHGRCGGWGDQAFHNEDEPPAFYGDRSIQEPGDSAGRTAAECLLCRGAWCGKCQSGFPAGQENAGGVDRADLSYAHYYGHVPPRYIGKSDGGGAVWKSPKGNRSA